MPRAPRKQFEGAVYHVTSRGNGRERIFSDEADRNRFAGQMRDCLGNYGVVLYAYVLMPNHFHLLVRTPRANLSRFMQRLNTSYALYSRYKHQKPGHRLEGRYHAKLVQGDEYLMTLTRYIHLNPAKVNAVLGLPKAERRALLRQPGCSSYAGYVDERRREEFVCYDVLRALDTDRREAGLRYRAYVLACLEKNDEELRRLLDRSAYGIGDEAYVEALERELRERRSGEARDRDVAYPKERVALERIDAVVARAYGMEPEALHGHGRRKGVGTGKAVAIELACRLSGLTQRDIGAQYGGISSQAVSVMRTRARSWMREEDLAQLTGAITRNSCTSTKL